MKDWLEREYPILGEDGVNRLEKETVAIVGIGGVGGYALEGIVRAGVGNIIIADGDRVSVSNINRQLIADRSNIGESKVAVAAKRIRAINPDCKVNAFNTYINESNCDSILGVADYILDCCDDTSAKVAMCVYAAQNGKKIISCMGTGNKTNPELLTVSDISKTSVCPLARAMRKKLGEVGIKHLTVVYSTETPVVTRRTPSSVSFVPSVAGMLMAGHVIKEISNNIK